MQIERIKFKEFTGDTTNMVSKPVKPFLPGGRFRGEAPPPPPAPTFTEAQIKTAERDSYQKGFVEGTADGRKQVESEQADVQRKLQEAAEGFVHAVVPLFVDYRTMALQIKQEVPEVALAIARKVAGAALNDNAKAAVEEMAERCVTAMISEPGLVITVHESLAEALEQKLALLAATLQEAADITVMRDPAMSVADCKIEWKDGAFVRDTAKLWLDIEQVVGRMTASAAYDTQTHLETVQPGEPPVVGTTPDTGTPPITETPTETKPKE